MKEVDIDDFNALREDLDHLYKTVYQGNGSPPLVGTVSNLEHRLESLEDKIERNFETIDTEMTLKFKNITDVVNEKFNHISYQIANEFEKKRTTSSSTWTFRTSILTACAAGVCSILSVIIAEYLKRM
jgi:phosphotransacetylase